MILAEAGRTLDLAACELDRDCSQPEELDAVSGVGGAASDARLICIAKLNSRRSARPLVSRGNYGNPGLVKNARSSN